MQNKENFKSSARELIFGRGFYAALIICLLAAFIAIWAIASQNSKTHQAGAPLTSQSADSTTEPTRTGSTKPTTTAVTTKPQSETTTAETAAPSVPDEPVVDTQIPYFSYYVNPVQGRIIKYYSTALVYSDTMNDYRTHNGNDYLANSGDSVYAINKGEVVAIYEDELLGHVVEIDHAHDVIARYCGVKSSLKVGDKVNLGDSIGTVDVVYFEAVDDTHVHLEILYNGKYVDPIDLMSKSGSEDE